MALCQFMCPNGSTDWILMVQGQGPSGLIKHVFGLLNMISVVKGHGDLIRVWKKMYVY